MLTLMKYGDASSAINKLQAALAIPQTGIFDSVTQTKVVAFQTSSGLAADGVVGAQTIAKLGLDLTPNRLTDADYASAAQRLSVSPAQIKCFAEVETAHSAFLDSGDPQILFERHIFFDRLDNDGTSIAARNTFAQANPDICNPARGGYKGGQAEYDRLARAKTLNSKAALESASWGMFQIMGYNAPGLHYVDVFAFVRAMQAGEVDHLESFVRFIRADPPLLDALKRMDWAICARLYNGADYRVNNYDQKLAAAYKKYSS